MKRETYESGRGIPRNDWTVACRGKLDIDRIGHRGFEVNLQE
jgi:hypothetical protein